MKYTKSEWWSLNGTKEFASVYVQLHPHEIGLRRSPSVALGFTLSIDELSKRLTMTVSQIKEHVPFSTREVKGGNAITLDEIKHFLDHISVEDLP